MGSIPVAGASRKGLLKGRPFLLAPAQTKPLCKRSEAELGSHIPSEDRQASLSGVGQDIFTAGEIPCFRDFINRTAKHKLCRSYFYSLFKTAPQVQSSGKPNNLRKKLRMLFKKVSHIGAPSQSLAAEQLL